MKQTIRKNVFETNSSSTHAVVIPSDDGRTDLESLDFEITAGEYGWENRKYYGHDEILSYFFTLALGIDENNNTNYVEQLKELLPNCSFIMPDSEDWYYVDHSSDKEDMMIFALEHMSSLLSNGYVQTGNDNDDEMLDIPNDAYAYMTGSN